jgi:DNA-binding LacI/PurR family transcriptional regulator
MATGDGRRTDRRRPTLEDVAARSGVSRALASIVMRDVAGASAETRKRVLAVAAELGYRPDARAQLLARSRSRQLGVVFTSFHAFHADLLDGLYQAAGDAGYELILSAQTPNRDEASAVDTLLGYRCDALILLGPDSPARYLLDLAERVPVVVVGRRLGRSTADVVRTSDHHGMRLAVDHLVGLGHRDIVHLDGGGSPKAPDRRRGYRAAMTRHRLADRIRIHPAGQDAESGAEATRQLFDGGPLPTAVVAFNDDCAVAVVDALARGGVTVPGDVSVVGFDDSRLSRLPYVSLTTVGQDARHQATIAVERAVARLEAGEEPAGEVVLPPHLVVRGTTAPVSEDEPLRAGGGGG